MCIYLTAECQNTWEKKLIELQGKNRWSYYLLIDKSTMTVRNFNTSVSDIYRLLIHQQQIIHSSQDHMKCSLR